MKVQNKSTKKTQAKEAVKKITTKNLLISKILKKKKAAPGDDQMVLVRPAQDSCWKVPPFRIGRCLVTLREWDEVAENSLKKGYDIKKNVFKNKNDQVLLQNHPTIAASLRNIAKWCNAKSELAGLRPCYTIEGKTFKSGNKLTSKAFLEWNRGANGYRLATEKEWLHASLNPNFKVVLPLLKSSPKKEEENPPNALGIYNIGKSLDEYVWELYWYPQMQGEFTMIVNAISKSLDGNKYPTMEHPKKPVGFRLVRNAA